MLEAWFKVTFSIMTSDRFDIFNIKEEYFSSNLHYEGVRKKCYDKYKKDGIVYIYKIKPINRKYERLLLCNDKIDKNKIYSLLTPKEIELLNFDDLTFEQKRDILEKGNLQYFIDKKIIGIKKLNWYE